MIETILDDLAGLEFLTDWKSVIALDLRLATLLARHGLNKSILGSFVKHESILKLSAGHSSGYAL